ncbi:DNA mismatch repair protein [Candidatus Dojkabacteria bacterium]|nr:DNA mismatch repair protein [Candidatus Dojkabacteria bacterium]
MRKCKYGQYDEKSKESILEYALLLLNKSLFDLYAEEIEKEIVKRKGKGSLGQLVEELHFNYEPNEKPVPDFPEANLELKTTPLKIVRGEYVSKERLVLNMIDYFKIVEETFDTSSFLKKNSSLLLMFYLFEKGEIHKQIFKLIKIWDIPKNDYLVIKEDWEKIASMVREGRAEEISGGDTFYLEAARKGAGKGKDLTKQPYSDVLANRRAFAFKSRYVNEIIKADGSLESVLDEEFNESKKTVEQYIIDKFKPYLGKSLGELEKIFNLSYSKKKKDKTAAISKAILGVSEDNKIAEFEKANIQMKTIPLSLNGRVKESMSFSRIYYKKIINEKWLDSDFYNKVVDRKFFFVIFRDNKQGNRILERVMFWNMPSHTRKIAKEYWLDIRRKVRNNDTSNFWKISDKKVFHVRPKARNAMDTTTLRDGTEAPKLAYWINAKYIESVIEGQEIG